MIGGVIFAGLVIATAAGVWRTFVKAGFPGWYALVPVLNLYTWIKVADLSGWWMLIYAVPGVNYIAMFYVNIRVAREFGVSWLFGVGLTFLPFIFAPILGFSSIAYDEALRCFDCGTTLQTGAPFCGHCGAPVNGFAAASSFDDIDSGRPLPEARAANPIPAHN